MGCCLATAACSAAGCLCRMCTSCNNMSEKAARWVYVIMMVVASIIALLLKYFGGHIFVNPNLNNQFYAFRFSCGHKTSVVGTTVQAACAGNSAVYRISMGMVVFFLFIGLVSVACKRIHTGLWALKIPAYLVCLIFPFFIPNDFFTVYQQIARVMSGFYLLLQILMLINFAHEIHENILDKSDEYQEAADVDKEVCMRCDCWKALYLFLSFGGIAGIIAATVVMYVYFRCFIGSFMPSLNLVFCVIILIMSLMPKFNKGLLTGVVVAGYSTYLCWSGLIKNPSEEIMYDYHLSKNVSCNPFLCDVNETSGNACNPGTMAMGIIFAACGLGYTGLRSGSTAGKSLGIESENEDTDSSSDSQLKKELKADDALEKALTQGKVKGKYQSVDNDATDRDDNETDNFDEEESDDDSSMHRCCGLVCKKCSACGRLTFHIIMHLSCWYMAMLLTNWAENTTQITVGTGKTSMWVQFLCQWISVGLFIWTCVAAFCCKNRDFD